MADTFLRQTPLAHLHLVARAKNDAGDAGVKMGERGFRAQWVVRGDASDEILSAAIRDNCACDLPTTTNTVSSSGAVDILWMGPDEWLVVAPDESDIGPRLTEACRDIHVAITDVSESRTIISLTGGHARDVLAKGCSLDLHPRSFEVGRCAQSAFAHNHVILHLRSDVPEFDVFVHRSFAEWLWTWMEDAAMEYGLAIYDPDGPGVPS